LVRKNVIRYFYDLRILILIVILITVFSSLSKQFRTLGNLQNFLIQISVDGIIAIGASLVLIVGEIDFSLGSVMVLSGIISVKYSYLGFWISIPVAIFCGVVLGFLLGIIVTKLKVNSFIASLSFLFIINGLNLYLLPRPMHIENKVLLFFGSSAIYYIPILTIFLILFVAVAQILLKFSLFGRKIYAIGGNILSSRYVGIATDRMKIYCFMISGFFTSIAGVFFSARTNSANALAGQETAIVVLTAIILGGVVLGGGTGNILMAISGIVVLGILTNGMDLLQVQTTYQNLIIGFILIATLLMKKYFAEST
jgi:ribose/xylose/arabinose/galactoside ABC-type transport system permease subunit